MEVTIKQVNDLCNMIAEALSLENFGEHDKFLLDHYLKCEFNCFPKEVKDHVRNIVSQVTNKQL